MHFQGVQLFWHYEELNKLWLHLHKAETFSEETSMSIRQHDKGEQTFYIRYMCT